MQRRMLVSAVLVVTLAISTTIVADDDNLFGIHSTTDFTPADFSQDSEDISVDALLTTDASEDDKDDDSDSFEANSRPRKTTSVLDDMFGEGNAEDQDNGPEERVVQEEDEQYEGVPTNSALLQTDEASSKSRRAGKENKAKFDAKIKKQVITELQNKADHSALLQERATAERKRRQANEQKREMGIKWKVQDLARKRTKWVAGRARVVAMKQMRLSKKAADLKSARIRISSRAARIAAHHARQVARGLGLSEEAVQTAARKAAAGARAKAKTMVMSKVSLEAMTERAAQIQRQATSAVTEKRASYGHFVKSAAPGHVVKSAAPAAFVKSAAPAAPGHVVKSAAPAAPEMEELQLEPEMETQVPEMVVHEQEKGAETKLVEKILSTPGTSESTTSPTQHPTEEAIRTSDEASTASSVPDSSVSTTFLRLNLLRMAETGAPHPVQLHALAHVLKGVEQDEQQHDAALDERPAMAQLKGKALQDLNMQAAVWVDDNMPSQAAVLVELGLQAQVGAQEPLLDSKALIQMALKRGLMNVAKNAMLLVRQAGKSTAAQIRAADKAVDESNGQLGNGSKALAEQVKREMAKTIHRQMALKERISKDAKTKSFCALKWFRTLSMSNGDICGTLGKMMAAKGERVVYKNTQMLEVGTAPQKAGQN